MIDTAAPDVVTQLPIAYMNKGNDDTVREVPHKNVTHALFFSSNEKRRQFEDLLVRAAPEGVLQGVLLVGGTPNSFKKARQALRAGNPVIALDELHCARARSNTKRHL